MAEKELMVNPRDIKFATASEISDTTDKVDDMIRQQKDATDELIYLNQSLDKAIKVNKTYRVYASSAASKMRQLMEDL